MKKSKKFIVSLVLVLVLMVAMATTAFAAVKTVYLYLDNPNPVYSTSVWSKVSHAYGYSYGDSQNNTIMHLQRQINGAWHFEDNTGKEFGPGYSATTPTHSYSGSYRFRVRLYSAFGAANAHSLGSVFDS